MRRFDFSRLPQARLMTDEEIAAAEARASAEEHSRHRGVFWVLMIMVIGLIVGIIIKEAP